MDILVINAGSSSLKYQLIDVVARQVKAKGLAERIGIQGGRIKHQYTRNGITSEKILDIELPNHKEAFSHISTLLTSADTGVIASQHDIKAVGHRVVHGGENFSKTQVITTEIKDTIKALIPLAPLHNPPNITGIEAAETYFPQAIQVAVFDTAFHHTLPEQAYRYAIPEHFYTDNSIRVYGFHGTSHKYVYHTAQDYLQKKNLKAITIHLGNGASMAAINDKGESVDTTLGFGPLCGLFMGTRSGDIDPAVIFHMAEEMNMPLQEIKNLLYKESGMLGLAGSSDARDVKALYDKGDKKAILTYNMYAYRIKKYIGAYMAVLNGVDAIIFTAGLGENDALLRSLSCSGMTYAGIALDEELNVQKNHPTGCVEIQQASSAVKILVIPTNEELQIAVETYNLIGKDLE